MIRSDAGFICCLGECRTVHKCTICSASPRFRMPHSHSDVNAPREINRILSLSMSRYMNTSMRTSFKVNPSESVSMSLSEYMI